MKRVNVNIFPKDGFQFVETDGTVIRATSGWKGVILRLVAYRKRNRLPMGDPAKEVHEQACARSPDTCHDDADPTTVRHLKIASLKGRALAWVAALKARPHTFVDEGLMRARANVCAGCPAHAPTAGGCGSCKKALKGVRQEVLGGRPIDDRMAGCLVLGEDTGVNTWLADPTVANSELPKCCWRLES